MTEHPDHQEGLLGWLDSPRLVVGAFAFFLCGLTVLGILLWSDQRDHSKRIDSIIAEREAELHAANAQTVARCFANANLSPALDRVLRAIEGAASTPDGRQAVRDFRALNEINSNTLRECHQLARKLNVPPPRGAG